MKLLGASDLGVSLHTSSSGLDLPMKVVDMFGCGLPVCAVGFRCLNELVQHGHNGLVFTDAVDLVDQFRSVLRDFPKTPKLETFRHNLKDFRENGWDSNWNRCAAPMFGLRPSDTRKDA